ncbi:MULTISPECIES: glycosyltransferase family 2 protein [Rhodobacterales]|uniref:glycosyltransferase family 2 protein n=1 Tax=Rhodobacterales TaxID=204455 RepID=UPI003299C550
MDGATRADAVLEKRRPLISIICPVFNEEDNVANLHAEVSRVFENAVPDYDHELIFTDNHSTDDTFGRLSQIAEKDPRVRVARFARNFGFHKSVMTGYRLASGDAAIQIDCDLQDPPDLFVEFLQHWEDGHDAVVGVRRNRDEPKVLQTMRNAFYHLMNKLAGDSMLVGGGDFRLIDRSILDQLRWIDDVQPYTRGLTSSLARRQIGVPFDRKARQHGESKYPLRRLFGLAAEGVLAHSILPLRIASFVGLLIAVATVLLTGGYLIGGIFFGSEWPSGFSTLVVLTLFGIGLNAIFLGVIGEYVGRLYLQMQKRPMTIIEQTANFPSGVSEHSIKAAPKTSASEQIETESELS